MNRWLRAVPASGAALLTVGVVAVPAHAAPVVDVVAIGTPRLVASGVAVDVPVTVRCAPSKVFPPKVSISAQVLQRVSGGRVATAYGGRPQLQCDSTSRTYTIRVYSTGLAFKAGTGLADAYADRSTETTFASDTMSKVVRLR